MTLPGPIRRELSDLFWSLGDESFSPADVERLEHLAEEYPEVRKLYAQFMAMCGVLQWERISPHDLTLEQVRDERRGIIGEGLERAEGSGEWRVESGEPSAFSAQPSSIPQSPIPNPSAVTFLLDPSPTIHYPLSTIHSFIGSALFSYLTAALILGVGILIAWAWKVTGPLQIAEQSLPPASKYQREPESKVELVGRITGLADCRWADPRTAALISANVRLGRKYALASGLLEITYNTGAKVILQGPCTYEAESNGGYLAVGKLTGKVEKKDKRETINDKRSIQRSAFSVQHSSNPQSLISNPSLSTNHSPLFTIKTPTATVTDLGTEFGVEVNRSGDTFSHVFRGSVRLQLTCGVEGQKGREAVLVESESARVEKSSASDRDGHITILGKTASPEQFVRSMPPKQPSLRVLEYFRLGENDPIAVAGQPAKGRTYNDRNTQYLEKQGSPSYTANTAARGSSLAMNFTGATGECFFKPDICMSPTDNFILEAWARPNRVPNELIHLAYNGQSGRNGYGLMVKCGRWGFLVCDAAWGGFGVPCEPGRWTHLALVCERGELRLFVNGRPDGPFRNLAVNYPDGPFVIGGDPGGLLQSFDGQIDEVRLSEFRGPFSPEMLLFTTAANPSSAATDISQVARAKEEPVHIHTHVALSDPNNIAPLAIPTASSCVGAVRGLSFTQVANAIDGKVHSSTWETPAGADADATSFIFADDDDAPTLDLSWEQPQHLKSLQAYVCAGGANNGITDFDRAVTSVTFFVDRGLGVGWELAGTVPTVNTNDIGAFDLVKLDGDWSNVKKVRYQFPKAEGVCSGPRVAEVLAIADPHANESRQQPTIPLKKDGVP